MVTLKANAHGGHSQGDACSPAGTAPSPLQSWVSQDVCTQVSISAPPICSPAFVLHPLTKLLSLPVTMCSLWNWNCTLEPPSLALADHGLRGEALWCPAVPLPLCPGLHLHPGTYEQHLFCQCFDGLPCNFTDYEFTADICKLSFWICCFSGKSGIWFLPSGTATIHI